MWSTLGANSSNYRISGSHNYFDIRVVRMKDACDRGEAWRTWENAKVVDWSEKGEGFEGTEFQWLDFGGRWGDVRKMVSGRGGRFVP